MNGNKATNLLSKQKKPLLPTGLSESFQQFFQGFGSIHIHLVLVKKNRLFFRFKWDEPTPILCYFMLYHNISYIYNESQ